MLLRQAVQQISGSSARILFLHIGMQRTGSSALQVAFARSSACLRENGVNYFEAPGVAAARRGQTTAGNGTVLFSNLWPDFEEPWRNRRPRTKIEYNEMEARLALDKYFRGPGYFTNYSKALASSELFSWMPGHAWERLKICAPGVDVRVIAVVRNVLPALISLYRRVSGVKVIDEPFEEYVMRPELYRAAALRNAVNTFGLKACTVIHYESDRHRLAEKLFEAIGVTVPEGVSVPVINSWPGEVNLTPEGRLALEDRYKPDVEWLNRTFFGGNQVVTFD